MSRPTTEECAEFYRYYIGLVEGEDATALPALYQARIKGFFNTLPEERGSFAYAPDKWTLKQVIQHLLDVERIFVYRLLWIVRGGQGSLPGFDENQFAMKGTATNRLLQDLCEEWLALRESTDRLIVHLDSTALQQKGMANNSLISVKALSYIIYGHVLHHMSVIKERYLLPG
ncbi:MAG: DinB family protein [Sphingomonadales bacterium]|nr:DinB family protein [Sphingomonadales bacterium]